MIPYGRQNIDEEDIQAVVKVLKSDFITTGPLVEAFEKAVCNYTHVKYGVAVSSGTAALHAAMFAVGIQPGDEVIVPAITFAATANCVLYQGGTPVFCDVDPDTLLIDVNKMERLITRRTRAVIVVDYAGLPCDYTAIQKITQKHGAFLVSDACHSLGAMKPIADIACYSFHPVKHITTGEGGMAVTDNIVLADRMRRFRNHGMENGRMISLGYNYRITDFQCALGISQLKNLGDWIRERRRIAGRYDEALTVRRLRGGKDHVYHLYVVKVRERDRFMEQLLEKGIRTQIHYRPVYYHPYYPQYGEGYCPEAEKAYREILSLPIYPGLKEEEQDHVIKSLEELAWQG